MTQDGSSPENEPHDPFALVAQQILEILSATGVTSCEMTLTMNDTAGEALTSTLTVEADEIAPLDEDRAPDQAGLGGVFALFAADDGSQQS